MNSTQCNNNQALEIPSGDPWIALTKRIQDIQGDEMREQSYRKSLTMIMEKAKEWELDPSPLVEASKENLIRMIHYAKVLIEHEHPAELQVLFLDAEKLTVSEFRLKYGVALHFIQAERFEGNQGPKYFLNLPEEQFLRFQRASRLLFEIETNEHLQVD